MERQIAIGAPWAGLLFDRDYHRKPAYEGLRQALQKQ